MSTRLAAAPFSEDTLAALPTLQSLASAPITVDPRDHDFAPPAISNQWSGLVAGRDLVSYAGLACPGLYHDSIQAELFLSLDGNQLRPAAEAMGEITYLWEASRILRSGRYGHLELEAVTSLGTAGQVVLTGLTVHNTGSEPARLDVVLRFLADVRSKLDTSWPPKDPATAAISLDPSGTALRFREAEGDAAAVVGASRPPASVATFAAEDPRWAAASKGGSLDGAVEAGHRHAVLHYRLEIAPGASETLELVHVMASSLGEARALHWQHRDQFAARLAEARREWDREWRAAFTPGNGRYSGYLPVLSGGNEKLRRLYYMSVLTLLQCKRTARWGEPGWVYATGFPSSVFTFPITWAFPWDAMMVTGTLSLLDPAAMRAMLEAWLEADLHQGCAVDFQTGRPVGFWYAVNDYALVHMVDKYVRYTGDRAFLDQQVRGESVLEHLVTAANYYQRIADADGLADYGGAENLLECVSTYTHKVASFNAANAWNLRTVAGLLEMQGQDERASELRERAAVVASEVQALYLPGEGYWQCKQPDGSLVPVRHCLDFFTVAQCMAPDLKRGQLDEMIAFFQRELKTSTWMHALSPLDPDAAHSARTDHQDEGAYTTWPAYCLEVLLQAGHVSEALDWIGDEGKPGIADVTLQGSFGQAYCHGDEDSPRFAGAGAKAPMEEPHIEKPTLIAGGKYAQVIIEALAGVRPEATGISAQAPALPFQLSLDNLLLHGSNHRLTVEPGGDGR